MKNWKLKNKKVLVTGGSNGIGKACVIEIAQLGAEVIFTARQPAPIKEVQELEAISGLKVTGMVSDITVASDRNQLVEKLVDESVTLGIRVNAISPWYTRTPLTDSVLNDETKFANILQRTPLGRVAAFLAMDASSYVTGQNIAVDGGMLSQGL